jgi:hypothetical protein
MRHGQHTIFKRRRRVIPADRLFAASAALQQIEKMEIAQEQLSKKSAHQVSAAMRLQASACRLLACRWVREIHNPRLILSRTPSQLLKVALRHIEDLDLVCRIGDLGQLFPLWVANLESASTIGEAHPSLTFSIGSPPLFPMRCGLRHGIQVVVHVNLLRVHLRLKRPQK